MYNYVAIYFATLKNKFFYMKFVSFGGGDFAMRNITKYFQSKIHELFVPKKYSSRNSNLAKLY